VVDGGGGDDARAGAALANYNSVSTRTDSAQPHKFKERPYSLLFTYYHIVVH
jgi:hypothetical protein